MAVAIRDINDEGVPLIDYVQGRVGARPAQRVVAFMQAWDVVADELGTEPTLEQYAERWRTSRGTAYSDQRLFQEAFPGERTPRRVLHELWALRRNGYGPLLSAKIAITGSSGAVGAPVLRVGQKWRKPDGDFITVQGLDGNTVHGVLHHDEAGADSVWVGSPTDLGVFTLVGDESDRFWLVAVDVTGDPGALHRALGDVGFTVERVGTPADPIPDRGPYAATIEARVSAADEYTAREKLLAALPGQQHLREDSASVRIRPLK